MVRLIVGIVIGLSLAYGLYSVEKHYQQPPPEVVLDYCEKINQFEMKCVLSNQAEYFTSVRFRHEIAERRFAQYQNVSYKF